MLKSLQGHGEFNSIELTEILQYTVSGVRTSIELIETTYSVWGSNLKVFFTYLLFEEKNVCAHMLEPDLTINAKIDKLHIFCGYSCLSLI